MNTFVGSQITSNLTAQPILFASRGNSLREGALKAEEETGAEEGKATENGRPGPEPKP
jgi:hypothetical protein